MNYDQAITDLVEAIKADKALVQPFKNYATSDLLRVQAVVRMAKQTTQQQAPVELKTTGASGIAAMQSHCWCPIGAVDNACPVHGNSV